MFLELHESLSADRAAQCPVIREWVVQTLQGHRLGNFILLLTRRQVVEFSKIGLGNTPDAILNFISNRLNEYAAAASLSRRILVAYHNEIEANYRIDNGVRVRIGARLIDHDRCAARTFFLAENITDIKFIDFLCEQYLSQKSYPHSLINYRAVLGGGSTLAEALQNEGPTPFKGLVFCDRDTAAVVPPFPSDTTGRAAHDRAIALAAVGESLGWSQISPMFAFDATWGRTLENYVSPNLLEAYFQANNRREERKLFTAAFPSFPRLQASEAPFWRMLNLKDGTKPAVFAQVLETYRDEVGQPPNSILPNIKNYGSVKIPGDAISWFVTNSSASRHSRNIARAFAVDLEDLSFETAIARISQLLREVAAGDRRASRL